MTRSIEPSKEVIILRELTEEERFTDAGVYIPVTKEENKPEVGKVIAIGAGDPPIKLKVGDKIIYKKYVEYKVPIDAQEYIFILFKDVLAVVHEEA